MFIFVLRPKSNNWLFLSFSVIPSVIQVVQEYKPVVHRLRLSASPQVLTYPGRTSLPQEPLVKRWMGFSPILRYSYRHSHFLTLQHSSRYTFSAVKNAPLPLIHSYKFATSVICLAPVHLRRSVTRLVSYYALFKGWLLLSQPPSCFDNSTSFPTQHIFWDLSWRSGFFSFCVRTLSPAH